MDSAYVFEEPPSDICMVDAPEVYKLLGIPTTMIPILETSPSPSLPRLAFH